MSSDHLDTFLCINVSLDDCLADVICRTGKIRARPHRRQFQKHRKLTTQVMCCKPLARFHHIRRTIFWPDAYKQMHMVGLDCQLKYCPSHVLAFLIDKFTTTLCDEAFQNGLATARTPDQVVNDQVDAVFVALIFKGRVCLFHIMKIHIKRQICNRFLGGWYFWLKPARNPPNLCH